MKTIYTILCFFTFLSLLSSPTIPQKYRKLVINKEQAATQGSHTIPLFSSWKFEHATFPLTKEKPYQVRLPQPYVTIFENASLCTQAGIVLCNGKIYQDSLWAWSPLYKAPSDLFPLPTAEKTEEIVATIALEGFSNYYHWITEILPRIHLLQKASCHYDKLYTPSLRYAFQKVTLQALGIDLTTVIEATAETHLAPKKLIFPSQVAQSCITPLWVVDFLHATFLKDYQVQNGKRRIFITRENASIRKIINEQEIFDFIEPYGFEKVAMEKLSVFEQAQLAQEAEIIMGTHGAGMTNIIFARPETKVIELFQEHLDTCFFDLCKVRNMEHYSIKTERIKELSQEDIDIRYRNTYIKIEPLKKSLLELFEHIHVKFEKS